MTVAELIPVKLRQFNDTPILAPTIRVPNAFPITDPARVMQNQEHVKRGLLFVSWIRAADGARFSATLIGGFKAAEKYVQAVQRFEKPSIVVIGREPYEGLPPKVSSLGATLVLPVQHVPADGQIVVPTTSPPAEGV